MVVFTDGAVTALAPMIGHQEVNPMRSYRWALVPLPFVILAVFIAALSMLVGLSQ